MALPTATTPIAKSLHTLTVIQQVARITLPGTPGPNYSPEAAIDAAMVALGLAGRPDPYGLRDRALFLMTREDDKKGDA